MTRVSKRLFLIMTSPYYVIGIITVEILDGKPQTADGLVYSYLVKKIMQPFKVQSNPPKPKPAVTEKEQRPSTPTAKTTKGIVYYFSLKRRKGIATCQKCLSLEVLEFRIAFEPSSKLPCSLITSPLFYRNEWSVKCRTKACSVISFSTRSCDKTLEIYAHN